MCGLFPDLLVNLLEYSSIALEFDHFFPAPVAGKVIEIAVVILK